MKVVIAGSRTIEDYEVVKEAIEASAFEITEVVSGAARGVDSLGEKYAKLNGIPIKRFVADWNNPKLGKGAGPARNEEMAQYADALIAIRKDNSRGTSDMIRRAEKYNLKVYIKDIKS